MRGKHEHRAKAVAQGTGDPARPETLDGAGQAGDQVVGLDLLQRHRADVGLDHIDLTYQPAEPGRDLLRISDRAGKQEQLHRRGEGEERSLVVIAAVRIREPVVLVDHQQLKARRGIRHPVTYWVT